MSKLFTFFLILLFIIFLWITFFKRNVDTYYSGYVVCKEYQPEHMCCSGSTKLISYSSVIVVTNIHHVHHKVPKEITIYVANKFGVNRIIIDTSDWIRFNPGDKVWVKNDFVITRFMK